MNNLVLRNKIKQHLKRTVILTGIVISVAAGVSHYQATADQVFVMNYTESLPHWAFIINRKISPRVGDMVFFIPPQNRFYGGRPFVKWIAAGPGDNILIIEQKLFINGEYFCELLKVAKDGSPLHPGREGVIPSGQYFIYSKHERSYDSRYEVIGWIPAHKIIGVVTNTIL